MGRVLHKGGVALVELVVGRRLHPISLRVATDLCLRISKILGHVGVVDCVQSWSTVGKRWRTVRL
jgi:hypothetical protein